MNSAVFFFFFFNQKGKNSFSKQADFAIEIANEAISVQLDIGRSIFFLWIKTFPTLKKENEI